MGLRDHGPPPRAQHGSEYAGIFSRGIAFGLDAGIIYLGTLAIGAVVGLVLSALDVFSSFNSGHILAGGAVFLCLWAVYLTSFWAVADQTPGMWWMRIAVLRQDRGDVGWARAFTRAVGTGLSVLPFFLGFLPILFTKRRRGFNDVLAGTVVVYRPQQRDEDVRASRFAGPD